MTGSNDWKDKINVSNKELGLLVLRTLVANLKTIFSIAKYKGSTKDLHKNCVR